MSRVIPKNYYQNPDTLYLAKDLLGKTLFTHFKQQLCSAKIIETEAYIAPDDRGSHAYNNLRTKRTETMFGEGGRAYIYLCYGIHSMVNVVTGPKESAHAVLIRAVEPLSNFSAMKSRVKTKKKDILLGSGPGNVCKSMGITTQHNNLEFFTKENIWIEDNNITIDNSQIIESPRVGIAYAKEWANRNWRFYIKDHPSVSKPKIVKYDFK